jgi:hypothetical protein
MTNEFLAEIGLKTLYSWQTTWVFTFLIVVSAGILIYLIDKCKLK